MKPLEIVSFFCSKPKHQSQVTGSPAANLVALYTGFNSANVHSYFQVRLPFLATVEEQAFLW